VSELTTLLAFLLAHFAAWRVHGGSWRAAVWAPIAVFPPAASLLLLDAVMFDNYGYLLFRFATLIGWQFMYYFVLLFLKVMWRAPSDGDAGGGSPAGSTVVESDA
jgi:hypothetical protein